MRGLVKWCVVAAVVVAVLGLMAPSQAQAARWVVRAYGGCAPYYGPYVYGYPTTVYYGAYWTPPAVVVYRPPVVVAPPVYPPPYVGPYVPVPVPPIPWW